MHEDTVEIRFSRVEKVVPGVIGLLIAGFGVAAIVAALIPSWRGQNSPAMTVTMGLILLPIGILLCQPARVGIKFRADRDQLVIGVDFWPHRIRWNEVDSYYFAPDSWFAAPPNGFIKPTLLAKDGRILFNGLPYSTVSNREKIAEHQRFWAFVEAQLEGKRRPAPAQNSAQRLLRRQNNRNWQQWNGEDWKWKARRSTLLIFWTLAFVTPTFGGLYALLNWYPTERSLIKGLLGVGLMGVMVLGPMLVFGCWQNRILRRAGRREARKNHDKML